MSMAVCGRECDAQAGGAFGHGRRAYRSDQYALVQKLFADRNRGLGIADNNRLDCSLAVRQFNTHLLTTACEIMNVVFQPAA